MRPKGVVRVILFFLLVSSCFDIFSQEKDTLYRDSLYQFKYLSDITVIGRSTKMDIQQMPKIVGTSIYAGKKSSLIVMDNVMGNLVNNTMRQVVAKVPGIQIWENDGSGIQVGISARGLSPNRSWEFNVRQNGYDIAADPYGYPEAYYNPSMQAVQSLEIIRGHGALQYGPQFGGMVNYILKNGSEKSKKIEAESYQTIGSNGMFNTFNAIGGRTKKMHYYAFIDHRNAEGYRSNSRYFTNAGFGTVTYRLKEQLELTAEYMRSHSRSQQPGGLMDSDFKNDIKRSYRGRNWMDIDWSTMSISLRWKPAEISEIQWKIFALNGDRNSVGFMPTLGLLVGDTVSSITYAYNPRNLNADNYKNYGTEVRSLFKYSFFGNTNHLSSGIRIFRGTTNRLAADNKGTVGANYTMNLSDGIWNRDLNFASFNTAVFIENMFSIKNKLLIIPGIRYENVEGSVNGRNGFSGSAPIILQNIRRSRKFLIAGVGAEYHINKYVEWYGNISQAYRPVQFAELSAPPSTDVIDTQLKDANGYNADLGFRGKYGDALFFDASIYHLQYNRRIGTIVQQNVDGSFYNYRTNVGKSWSNGIEALVEYSLLRKLLYPKKIELRIFSSFAFNDSKYGDFKVVIKSPENQLIEKNLKNKKVENAPTQIIRSGVILNYKNYSLASQISHTGSSFSDANNTIQPSSNGNIGFIPSYTIYDLTFAVRYKKLQIKTGINNLTNRVYFTRRATGYPGPGAMPADGRTFFFTIGKSI